MSKRFTIAAAALALSCASTASIAASPGQVFINGSVGQSTYHDDFLNSSNTDTAVAGRVGYAWNVDQLSYGVEVGYADLGQGRGDYGTYRLSSGVRGPLAGANLTYRFPSRMFVHFRLGWMHDNFHGQLNGYRENFSGNGGYVGVGVGYDVNEHVGIGVAYDHYAVRGQGYRDSVGMLSGLVQFRF
ncbi:outer membrane beta-barrel protein [Dyella sp.]|jgi:hypothetical protein|uniref:outer membrane beta-barrel protein n=1 Tax=Dyella sp. TaxID=1869338 RepID=UPI002D77B9EA|nr:outer membrane beta-barrel protein [Dyella sp.]HET6434061.1 outer membrane beta-barrel protein [Dyella sp.]